ncbi:Type I inositol 1,4,5-trisphosphate 5-phosphatase CVP2 [Apostasia shenzhenica]|uniref:Type I inositol 1,4,5-trisphosphate 5-phosphatase CVP2 n=1 Tax=Apostasia shenzhenica TaxID=1088818 RepID=A0A2I0B4N2_9ASPA|nr:Type I inositol 1,4,5-trisphosphate 5-phosphatase CVP2 [Apostasia shenzhenica]
MQESQLKGEVPLSLSLSHSLSLSLSACITDYYPCFSQVMRPRMVANKLLRKPVNSTSFVSGYSFSGELHDQIKLNFDGLSISKIGLDDQQKETHKFKLFAGTWNVAGISPPEDLSLEDWLDIKSSSYDIYVLGFQEIVPLSAKNIFGPETNRISMKWNSLTRTTLNKYSMTKSKDDKPKVHPMKGGEENCSRERFGCIISKQMVGIFVSVWVRDELQPFIHHQSVSCVGCGIMGCFGNKGSVSVRFSLHETSFCIICCHLASGGKEGDEMHRNSNTAEIFSRTRFPAGASLNLPQKIYDHERIILLGDLNYRINLPDEETRMLVMQKEWEILLEKDQLKGEMEGGAFGGWQEGAISFSPTYKYYPNSDEYYGSVLGRKGEKKRSPAWCDRIIWYGSGMKQTMYSRCESKLSDHRPVHSGFNVEVEAVINSTSEISERLSMPERINRISSKLKELLLANDKEDNASFYEHLS